MRETTIETGAVRGIACGWPSITAFYGIPYATPPVGELRWRAPVPASPWQGVRDAARPSARCPQLGVGKGSFYEKEFYPVDEAMSEDCLYLNVWTPAADAGERLPVLFWIHGGAFLTGYGHSAHFDGEHFARQGVIVVTINYRLNVFGWMTDPALCAETEQGVSGNYGLLDQIAALGWVRRNIAAFGGDADRITVGGQSAGAMCVQALLASPLTHGQIAGAILQSGGGLTPMPDMRFPTLEASLKRPALAALGVDCVAAARALSSDELLRRWRATMPADTIQRTPVLDGWVLPSPLEQASYPAIPYLIGYTADEGIPTDPDYESFARLIRREYGAASGDAFLSLCPLCEYQAYRRVAFAEHMQAAAESWAERCGAAGLGAYLYRFDRQLPGDEMGAFHAAELWYVFKTLMRCWRPFTGVDYTLADTCNRYWANFVRSGNPNGDLLPTWQPFSAALPDTMELGDRIGMNRFEIGPRVAFRKKFLLSL